MDADTPSRPSTTGVLALVVTLVFGVVLAPAAPALAAYSGPYQIKFEHSGKCLDLYQNRAYHNAKVQQWTCAAQGATSQGIVDARSSGASAPPSEYCFDDATPWYLLRNWKSRKFLEPGQGSYNGEKICPGARDLGDGSQLLCRISDGDYESFENVSAQMNLGIDRGSNANGAAAIIAYPSGAVNQDWLTRSTGYPPGVVALINRKSGLCLGISGGSVNTGAQAAQVFCDGSPNQGWEIVRRLL